jgi:hypothetical protein
LWGSGVSARSGAEEGEEARMAEEVVVVGKTEDGAGRVGLIYRGGGVRWGRFAHMVTEGNGQMEGGFLDCSPPSFSFFFLFFFFFPFKGFLEDYIRFCKGKSC